MTIREITENEFKKIWPIFYEIVSAGETYPYSRDTSKEKAKKLWFYLPRKTYVLEIEGQIVGTYYIKNNQPGAGSHVCNCGYMVSSKVRGKGFGTLMCQHSQLIAEELGYKAMQFNLVVSTNDEAVRLWRELGFDIVGRLPLAFKHPTKGYVDAFVMFKWLEP
jgi:RimJ/RimL family protein N-acetyltransferase